MITCSPSCSYQHVSHCTNTVQRREPSKAKTRCRQRDANDVQLIGDQRSRATEREREKREGRERETERETEREREAVFITAQSYRLRLNPAARPAAARTPTHPPTRQAGRDKVPRAAHPNTRRRAATSPAEGLIKNRISSLYAMMTNISEYS